MTPVIPIDSMDHCSDAPQVPIHAEAVQECVQLVNGITCARNHQDLLSSAETEYNLPGASSMMK